MHPSDGRSHPALARVRTGRVGQANGVAASLSANLVRISFNPFNAELSAERFRSR